MAAIQQLNNFYNTALGAGRLNLDTRSATQNYDIAQRQVGNQAASRIPQYDPYAATNQNLKLFESQAAMRNADAAQKAASKAQLDDTWLRKYIADQQFALGNESNRINAMSANQDYAARNRQLSLQQASDEFNRIMRGVSEASLPGVRAGNVPSMGVFG
jgi:hypothetical protein